MEKRYDGAPFRRVWAIRGSYCRLSSLGLWPNVGGTQYSKGRAVVRRAFDSGGDDELDGQTIRATHTDLLRRNFGEMLRKDFSNPPHELLISTKPEGKWPGPLRRWRLTQKSTASRRKPAPHEASNIVDIF